MRTPVICLGVCLAALAVGCTETETVFVEVPAPTPGPGQVLVRTAFSVVAGSPMRLLN